MILVDDVKRISRLRDLKFKRLGRRVGRCQFNDLRCRPAKRIGCVGCRVDATQFKRVRCLVGDREPTIVQFGHAGNGLDQNLVAVGEPVTVCRNHTRVCLGGARDVDSGMRNDALVFEKPHIVLTEH